MRADVAVELEEELRQYHEYCRDLLAGKVWGLEPFRYPSAALLKDALNEIKRLRNIPGQSQGVGT